MHTDDGGSLLRQPGTCRDCQHRSDENETLHVSLLEAEDVRDGIHHCRDVPPRNTSSGGWRVGVVVLALLLALSTLMVHRIAFRESREAPHRRAIAKARVAATQPILPGPNLWFPLLAFGLASL